MHFSISVIGNKFWFTDIALPCYFALRSLGFRCELLFNAFSGDSVNIVFGAHSLKAETDPPKNAIIYNFEQLSGALFTDLYLERLRSATAVWDFSLANVVEMEKQYHIRAKYVFPGYVPEMSCLECGSQPGIDLFFYGTQTKRREDCLAAIKARGMNPLWANAFGHKRDALIATAAMVLNVHARVPASLEVARLGFLWANSKAVVSEDCPEHGLPEGLEDACFYAPYEQLPESAMILHKNPGLREKIGKRGYRAFRAKPLARILEKVVGRPVHPVVSATSLPDSINVGSGGDFRPYCLNIDINPIRNPDLLLDLSQPIDLSQTYESRRFGRITLQPGSFKKITVHHVLEHIRDLAQMMTNFLTLLEMGGELHIGVPYDLSLGAWQDPTHVRAFNENSWIYYCEWHGYLGWKDACFELVSQDFELTGLGQELKDAGRQEKEILRTPRAVAAINVILRKVEAREIDRYEMELEKCAFYKKHLPGWLL